MPFNVSRPSSIESEDFQKVFFAICVPVHIPGLLSHQADILREYVEKAMDKPDVAFQLPTGSGKTLVGLLLGEWRRRNRKERVLYLCPTRQLVHQVAEQANSTYGMHVIPFVGPKAEYEPSEKSDYLNADAIAVAPYSALFNVKPFFENANLLILDDVHSSEGYIASPWSLRIDKFKAEHTDLFLALANLLRS